MAAANLEWLGNQITKSGLLLLMTGAVLAYMKEVPMTIINWIIRQISMSASVKDEDNAFGWVKEWFCQQEFVDRIRRVDMDSYVSGQEVAILPAPGVHWFWYKKRPYRAQYTRSTETKGFSYKRAETFQFWTFGRNRKVLEAFISDITYAHKQTLKSTANLYVWNDYWHRLGAYQPRKLDSVILPDNDVENMVSDMEWFLGAKEWYKSLGVPYHRGYLLYGTPGTGKSSLISGLADKFGFPIYLISLNEMNDTSLLKATVSIMPGSIVVLEDVDCMGVRQAAKPMNTMQAVVGQSTTPEAGGLLGVTLSGLLNALDGFKSPSGVMFVMTTNHIEKLDNALLRPGRVDYKMLFGNATHLQKLRLYQRFYPEGNVVMAEKFVMENDDAKTMADFQSRLMTNMGEPKPNGRVKDLTPYAEYSGVLN